MLPPAISSLVAGIKTPLNHFSGNVILKRESSFVSDCFGQLCSLHMPLVLRQFTPALLGKMVGVTHCPMLWVFGALG